MKHTELSPRQRQIVELYAQGMTLIEIAEVLAVSPRTIRSHCEILKDKLHVRSMDEAVRAQGLHREDKTVKIYVRVPIEMADKLRRRSRWIVDTLRAAL